jgi:hypothetical protein
VAIDWFNILKYRFIMQTADDRYQIEEMFEDFEECKTYLLKLSQFRKISKSE